MSMKAITVWQPWASLIIIGAKPYEFRDRSYLACINHPQPGERIAVHASARPIRPVEVKDPLFRIGGREDTTGLIVERAKQLLDRIRAAHRCRALPLGAVLGTAIIGTPCSAETIFGGSRGDAAPQDSDRGLFNWAWPLTSVEKFDVPVPARGQQGFWKWTA
jgi:hypothetical protein